MARSTVALDRELAKRVDAWAAKTGRPNGPGHRTDAVNDLVRYALACDPADIDGPPEHWRTRQTSQASLIGVKEET